MNIDINDVRVRFAPSPTGFLHVGGARTAIFNWLFARHYNGVFLVRIEDTDEARSDQQMVDAIFDGLNWLGIQSDEPPIFQSDRRQEYINAVEKLVASGHAFPCYCHAKEKQDKQYQEIERCPCRNYTLEQRQALDDQHVSRAIRFLVADGATTYTDLVHGSLTINHKEIEDFVILRSDGTPTYQLAVVIDDIAMKITHVIRGDDHISNTPKQILLYNALNKTAPTFAHVPLILGPDKKRLSKRHGATKINEYQDQGFLAEALFNYLTLLGWNPGNDQEYIPRDELVQMFSIERVNPKSAIFDDQKLQWLNAQYISRMDDTALAELIKPLIIQHRLIRDVDFDINQTIPIVSLLKTRMKLLTDFISLGSYFFNDPGGYDQKAQDKHWHGDNVAEIISDIITILDKLDKFDVQQLEAEIREYAIDHGFGLGAVIHPIRLALTGSGASPGMFEVIALLGKPVVLRRLKKALNVLKA
ncbi:glutamate--tRNA ligase [candidate division KSB1 bacterium]|nr:glutamate--tRNA ligase [candidate division KSB1 bacterium]